MKRKYASFLFFALFVGHSFCMECEAEKNAEENYKKPQSHLTMLPRDMRNYIILAVAELRDNAQNFNVCESLISLAVAHKEYDNETLTKCLNKHQEKAEKFFLLCAGRKETDESIKAIKILLKSNVDRNPRDIHGWIPLMDTIERGNTEIAILLLQDEKSDVNATDKQ